MMLTRFDGVILYVSPACKAVLGYESEDLIGKVSWIVHPEDLERVQKVLQTALTQEASGIVEYRILTKNGEVRWLNHSYSQISKKGKIKQVVSIVRDISQEKQARAKLI